MTGPVDRAKALLLDMEQDLPGCDMLDAATLLELCGYQCVWEGEIRTFTHNGGTGWTSPLTFVAAARSIPMTRMVWLLGMVRAQLEREQRL